MKKKHYFLIALITLSAILFNSQRQNKNRGCVISDIILMNIECLSTPELPKVDCWYYGSIDCPGTNIKVLYYS